MSRLNSKTNKILNNILNEKKYEVELPSSEPLISFLSEIKAMGNQAPPVMSEELKIFLATQPQGIESIAPLAPIEKIALPKSRATVANPPFALYFVKKIGIAAAIIAVILAILGSNNIFPPSVRNPIFQAINSIFPFHNVKKESRTSRFSLKKTAKPTHGSIFKIKPPSPDTSINPGTSNTTGSLGASINPGTSANTTGSLGTSIK